jgi:hypothetical protein
VLGLSSSKRAHRRFLPPIANKKTTTTSAKKSALPSAEVLSSSVSERFQTPSPPGLLVSPRGPVDTNAEALLLLCPSLGKPPPPALRAEEPSRIRLYAATTTAKMSSRKKRVIETLIIHELLRSPLRLKRATSPFLHHLLL